jgi:hypothetical protein
MRAKRNDGPAGVSPAGPFCLQAHASSRQAMRFASNFGLAAAIYAEVDSHRVVYRVRHPDRFPLNPP